MFNKPDDDSGWRDNERNYNGWSDTGRNDNGWSDNRRNDNGWSDNGRNCVNLPVLVNMSITFQFASVK